MKWPWSDAKIRIMKNGCSCGNKQFIEGPKSGISINLCCSDPNCRRWWNYTPVLGTMRDLNRIEPLPGQAVSYLSEDEDKNLAEMRTWMDQGVEVYVRDGSPLECFIDRATNSTYNPTTPDMMRFAGFIEALQADVMLVRKNQKSYISVMDGNDGMP